MSALAVSCPVCEAPPGAPCRDTVIEGVYMATPVHLSREFHSIVAQSEGSPMAVPRQIKKLEPNVMDVADLTSEEERFAEEKEREDIEKAMGETHVHWPEED